ncbi:hypothetical protein IMCC1989_125 [gamma proteobacterium IMCC1989]|nr:hypothetical protein IMCC1989_125 [gamma proteobacterium IMCC1989]
MTTIIRNYSPRSSAHSLVHIPILEGKAKHSNHDIVDAFMATEDQFIEIAARRRDDYSRTNLTISVCD